MSPQTIAYRVPETSPVMGSGATRQRPGTAGRVGGSEVKRLEDELCLIADTLAPQRRVLHQGDVLYRSGDAFGKLYIVQGGTFKMVTLAADGREQVVGLRIRGDWLGFDGIADARYASDAVALDTCIVWVVPYDELIASALRCPALLSVMHEVMSRQIAQDSASMMSICTLQSDARVAEFLRALADALERRGLRADQITLRMTRNDIGNYLGMTLETVSRALSKLAGRQLITFLGAGRRDLRIPDMDALSRFVQESVGHRSQALQ